jgi:hypothetical protein
MQTRAPAQAGGGGGGGWMKTGAAARDQSTAEVARQRDLQAKRNQPRAFRFWVGVGQQREFIILDREPGPCFYEHQLQNPRTQKWDIHEACPKEWEPCPICDGVAGGKDSYYVMMLTCIELQEWTDKHGVTHPYSVRLLPVKAESQGFFLRQFDRYGSLRGMRLLMARDTKQSASIGSAEFVDRLTDEEIIQHFGHPPVVAQDGRVIKQANADCHPLDYSKLFRKPSAADLRARYGGSAPAGSRQEQDDVWGGHTPGQHGHAHSHAHDDGFDDSIPPATSEDAADGVDWGEPGAPTGS